MFRRGNDDRDAERKVEVFEPELFGAEDFAENSVERRDVDVVFRFGFDSGNFHQRSAGEDRRDAIARLQPVMSRDELLEAMATVPKVHASDALLDYLQALIAATRSGQWFVEGMSPRAGIALLRVSRARALLAGRDHVTPDDLQALLPQAIAHRLMPVPGAGRGRREQVRAMVEAVPLP